MRTTKTCSMQFTAAHIALTDLRYIVTIIIVHMKRFFLYFIIDFVQYHYLLLTLDAKVPQINRSFTSKSSVTLCAVVGDIVCIWIWNIYKIDTPVNEHVISCCELFLLALPIIFCVWQNWSSLVWPVVICET